MKKSEIQKQKDGMIEKSVSDFIEIFDTFDAWDVFREIKKQLNKRDLRKLTDEFIKSKLINGGCFLVDDLNMADEADFKNFCKENDINAMDFMNYKSR